MKLQTSRVQLSDFFIYKYTIIQKFNQLKELLSSATEDAEKFYDKQNSAAGTRLRKAMQDIKTLATDIRKEVTELKNKEK